MVIYIAIMSWWAWVVRTQGGPRLDTYMPYSMWFTVPLLVLEPIQLGDDQPGPGTAVLKECRITP